MDAQHSRGAWRLSLGDAGQVSTGALLSMIKNSPWDTTARAQRLSSEKFKATCILFSGAPFPKHPFSIQVLESPKLWGEGALHM